MAHPLREFRSLLRETPDFPVVIQGERYITRSELEKIAGGMARQLQEKYTLSENGLSQVRVLIRLPNSPEMMALILAVWSVGALPMLLSPRSPHSHQDSIQKFHQPVIVVDEENLSEFLRPPGPLLNWEVPDNADASVVFTSGSTGRPKGVVQRGDTLSDSTTRISEDLGYGSVERILVPIPMSHDYGWNQMLAGLTGGHTIILPRTPALIDVSKAVDEQKPSVIAGVPSLYTGLLMGVSGFENVNTSSVRFLISTGSPFPDRLYEMLRDRIPDAEILLNYGLTETFRSCCLRPQATREVKCNLGQPVKGVTISIVDADGCELPPGREGEIVHIGAGSFDRYLDDPERTNSTRLIVSGQPAVATGDMGYRDTRGFVYFAGRRDRLIKSMDINVNLNEVENLISSLDEVSEVAVFARANALTGTEIIAFCTLNGSSDRTEVKKAVSRALPPYMQPRQIYTGPALPRTPLGKVDYPEVEKICSGPHK